MLNLKKVQAFAGLYLGAWSYLKKIEELSGVPIQIVSVGPDRAETIPLANPFAK